jgi:hypothetical protein
MREAVAFNSLCTRSFQDGFRALFQPDGFLMKEAGKQVTKAAVPFSVLVPLYGCGVHSEELLRQLPEVHRGVRIKVTQEWPAGRQVVEFDWSA